MTVIGLQKCLHFQSIPTSIRGCGRENDDSFDEQYAGCDCEGDSCSPDDQTCACLNRCEPAYDINRRLANVNPYECTMQPILECNSVCSCSKNCANRVMQHGILVKLEVFDTEHKGHGVRTLQLIPANTFVCEYAGEVISHEVARLRSSRLHPSQCNYILAVNEHLGNGRTLTTYVDATFFGNVGRFINHSCDPNLYMVPVRIDNDIPKMCLFALEDINIGTELAYDYSGDLNSQELLDRGTPCHCTTTKCRHFLPNDPSLTC